MSTGTRRRFLGLVAVCAVVVLIITASKWSTDVFQGPIVTARKTIDNKTSLVIPMCRPGKLSSNTNINDETSTKETYVKSSVTVTVKNKTSSASPANYVHHVAFVKVYKAGSTTMMNILERFAYTRDLLIGLPKKDNHLSRDLSNVLPRPKNRPFDMLINHAFYDRKQFQKVLYADTKYVGIAREPLHQLVSAFQYYVNLYKDITGKNKLKTYLQNREKYEPSNAWGSYTNNRMSLDFGLPQKSFFDPVAIKQFLERLDSEMDLVIILERLSESLVLLKRLFCWQLKDILYIERNVRVVNRTLGLTSQEIKYHRNLSFADVMLYDYFVKRLDVKLQKVGPDVKEEVAVFNHMLPVLKSHCRGIANRGYRANEKVLAYNATAFNKPFNVSTQDCRLMLMDELNFVELSRWKQIETLINKAN